MKYNARSSAPSASDKNWINYTKGGYNYCIEIKNGSCLPNCTGYSFGRWRELLGSKPNLCLNQAEIWFTRNDGYQRGQTPKLGAVICWSLGDPNNWRDGSGHVAIVEQIDADGSIWISESGYSGYRFKYTHLPNTYAYPGTKLTFQGFIYLPIEFDNEIPVVEKKTAAEIAQEVIDGKWDTGATRKTKLTEAGYDYAEVQTQVNKLLYSKNTTTKKTNEEIAKEVLNGKWGKGLARKNALEAAGYNYSDIQKIVNKLLRR